jgi:hypothetical protein
MYQTRKLGGYDFAEQLSSHIREMIVVMKHRGFVDRESEIAVDIDRFFLRNDVAVCGFELLDFGSAWHRLGKGTLDEKQLDTVLFRKAKILSENSHLRWINFWGADQQHLTTPQKVMNLIATLGAFRLKCETIFSITEICANVHLHRGFHSCDGPVSVPMETSTWSQARSQSSYPAFSDSSPNA